MSQELIGFVYSAIGGGVAYDSIKKLLGNSYEVLKSYVKNEDKEKFEGALELLLTQNKELKVQIEDLKKGKTINIVNQTHNGSGDNVAGDKITKD